MRRSEASIRASLISPPRTAASTAFQATERSGGLSSWSTPALIARTATRASPYFFRTPSMASESVITTPSKPRRSRSRPVRMGRERVAGSPLGSKAGKTMCAVMTESTPAAIAALNGGASSRSHSAFEWVMTGRSTWLSVPVSPWPGKCLTVAATPAARNPRTCAATRPATACGELPKDRTPMTGLAGSTLTSASGA